MAPRAPPVPTYSAHLATNKYAESHQFFQQYFLDEKETNFLLLQKGFIFSVEKILTIIE